LPYLSALENAIVFKGALQMSRFTLLTYFTEFDFLHKFLHNVEFVWHRRRGRIKKRQLGSSLMSTDPLDQCFSGL